MRQIKDNQLQFGEVDISTIKPDFKSRDEIDKAVIGLQYIYTTPEIRQEVFTVLDKLIPKKISKKTGRPGMDLWKIFVLGVIRQVCNCDYDKLQNTANNHIMIRQLLGQVKDPFWSGGDYYELQTIKDNVSLLTPDILEEINDIVVRAGHKLLGGKKKEELHTSVDSFVVKTDVHFPSDISLLYDSVRKSISLTKDIRISFNKQGWRQSGHNIKMLKRAMRKVQKAKRYSKSNSEEKIKLSHIEYISLASQLLDKVKQSLSEISSELGFSPMDALKVMVIESYVKYGERHIELIERRVIHGETIPNGDKIFSIFEPHTRWISKGKAGVPVEFGLPVSIIKDQHGYILDYEVMESTSDVDVAIPLSSRAKSKYPSIRSCSFDKGYWSPSNRKALGELVALPVMPKKGRNNKMEESEANSKEFVELRRKHSAVESSINALDHCGLDKCYDHGLNGFKRCVGLSILARNIQTLGKHIKEKIEKSRKRKKTA